MAGRDELREKVRVALGRLRLGRSTKSVLMTGLRGVGKTVLLDRMREEAEAVGIQGVRLEAPENRSLPALLAPGLRVAMLRLSQVEKAKDLAGRALRALAGFAKLKLKYHDLEVGLDFPPEPGLADNGDLEHDLSALLETAGKTAQKAETVLALFVDELQYVEQKELAALITALHRMAQLRLPVMLVGAGLPQLPGLVGQAKSYAERLFEFSQIGALPAAAAERAVRQPVEAEGAQIDDDALELIVEQTRGYAYFLQEWGKHAWEAAAASPIDRGAVERASLTALAALDQGFFLVRFDRLTPAEKRYLRAMAQLGAGPHRSGDVAQELGRRVEALGPIRSQLIKKGMIWSPAHGDTAFTVPLFDGFMRRIMPAEDWKEGG